MIPWLAVGFLPFAFVKAILTPQTRAVFLRPMASVPLDIRYLKLLVGSSPLTSSRRLRGCFDEVKGVVLKVIYETPKRDVEGVIQSSDVLSEAFLDRQAQG